MLTKTLKLAAAAVAGAAMLVPSAVSAQIYGGPPGYYGQGYDVPDYGRRYYERAGYGRDARRGPPRGYGRGYYGRRGDRGRGYYRRCDRGTDGTILGAIAGGLLGNGVARRGDRTTGAIVGAGVGALAGRAIDRDC
jgi:hypothetical protein